MCCEENPRWVDVLSLVLLDLRTSVEEELNAAFVNILFGTSLRFPGVRFLDDNNDSNPQAFLNQSRLHLREIRLRSCTHVFVRMESVKRPCS